MLSLSPSTALAGIGYALMNQSENAIVGVMLGPDRVPILAITRKGADVLRGLLDMIGFATYGSFAHLVASTDRARAPRVYGEIVSLNLSLGVAAAAAYMAVNPSFVTRWVGGSFFGGPWLTLLIASQMLTMSVSYLINYLYRASGRLVRGSATLIVECAVRVPLMVLLASTIGLIGVPLAGLITSGVSAVLVHTWAIAELTRFSEWSFPFAPRVTLARIGIFALGAASCFVLNIPSWPLVFSVGFAVFAASAVLLNGIDPLLVGVRATARGILKGRHSRVMERN
jgi:O-antigen/teichoic acid export membrane protein